MNENFQKNLEGMNHKERINKEFNRLFGAFNLRTVQLEEMWISLLGMPIIETSEDIMYVNL